MLFYEFETTICGKKMKQINGCIMLFYEIYRYFYVLVFYCVFERG